MKSTAERSAIRVQNLGKRYQLGARERAGRTFREVLVDAGKAPFRRFQRLSGNAPSAETFWALDDVSFDVEPGEAIGIIGRNGAGKSTLLKILSRITEPTCGRAELRGRVSSLLEVGTGFHSELTGRENIFLNGAILGMTRAEIKRKFDEIVAFAEVERFLDTQVKHYSSGMYVRLAFAVAAHLEPEIFVVDEVLAVGDLGFQKKCLGKMKDVTTQGRTVLFVSHNLGAVNALCTRVVVLDGGHLAYDGATRSGVAAYTQLIIGDADKSPIHVALQNFATDSPWRLTSVEVLHSDGSPRQTIATGDDVRFRLRYQLDQPLPNAAFRLRLFCEERRELFRVASDPISGYYVPPLPAGSGYIDCLMPRFPFTSGTYYLDISLNRANVGAIHEVENGAVLDVMGGDFYGSGVHLTTQTGFFVCDHRWQLGPVQ